MIPIIKHRERKAETTYDRVFHWKTDAGSGFSFPCDKNGNLLNLNPAAKEYLEKCLNGTFDVIDDGICPYTHSWTEPAEARCHCGHVIQLASFTNTCEKCGRDYNMSGQDLAPRRFWGEEYGETASDILSIGHTIS